VKSDAVLAGGVAVAVLVCVGAALAWGDSARIGMPDAAALARGGVDALEAPERGAGAAFTRGVAWMASGGSLYTGTGLVAGRVRVVWASDEYAASLSVAQLASPVHRATECALVVRARRRMWTAGVGVNVGVLDFDGAEAIARQVNAMFGVGWHPSARASVVGAAHLEPRARASGDARWIAAAKFGFAPGAFLYVQRERNAGAPARSCFGVTLGTRAVDLSAGYDASARAHTLGGTWNLSEWITCAWGARTHPDLGWSHVWTCVLRLGSR